MKIFLLNKNLLDLITGVVNKNVSWSYQYHNEEFYCAKIVPLLPDTCIFFWL